MEKTKRRHMIGIIHNRSPEFFSYTLSSIISLITWTFLLYNIFSFVVYFFYHFFGLELTKSSKADWMENDHILFKNLLNALTLGILMFLGLTSLNRKSLPLFLFYLFCFQFFNISYVLNIHIPLCSLLSNTPNTFSYTTHTVFNLLLCGASISLLIYCGSYYFKSIGYFKYSIEDIPNFQIIREIKLRIDLMKMNINQLIISCGLNRFLIFKNCLFKKKDYYFMNMKKDDIDGKISENLYNTAHAEKVIEDYPDGNQHCSKKTLETEYEPLQN